MRHLIQGDKWISSALRIFPVCSHYGIFDQLKDKSWTKSKLTRCWITLKKYSFIWPWGYCWFCWSLCDLSISFAASNNHCPPENVSFSLPRMLFCLFVCLIERQLNVLTVFNEDFRCTFNPWAKGWSVFLWPLIKCYTWTHEGMLKGL